MTMALALPAQGEIIAQGSTSPADLAERVRGEVARQAGVPVAEVAIEWDPKAWERVLAGARNYELKIKDASLKTAQARTFLPVELYEAGRLRQIVLLPARVAIHGLLVRRGTAVTVRLQNGGLTLLAEGRLDQDSRLGQSARVRIVNFHSNRVLSGTLTGPKEVTITLEGTP